MGKNFLKRSSARYGCIVFCVQNEMFVKLSLLNAVKTILNVSADKVDVYKMNNE